MNQSLVDEIVANVLAKLQPKASRPVSPVEPPKAVETPKAAAQQKPTEPLKPVQKPQTVAAVSTIVELASAVITADMLASAVKPGQSLRIGRTTILTPSARDWLNSNRMAWSRQERTTATKESGGNKTRWQVVLQTVTPTVKALQDGLRRTSDGLKIQLVGQADEAATVATNLICTAERDGVVIFTEQAELIACHANRNEKVRAAVMQNSKQWEQVMKSLSANVVCINPIGRSFVELRNLLRDCVGN